MNNEKPTRPTKLAERRKLHQLLIDSAATDEARLEVAMAVEFLQTMDLNPFRAAKLLNGEHGEKIHRGLKVVRAAESRELKGKQ